MALTDALLNAFGFVTSSLLAWSLAPKSAGRERFDLFLRRDHMVFPHPRIGSA